MSLPDLCSLSVDTDGDTTGPTLNEANQRNLRYIFCLCQHSLVPKAQVQSCIEVTGSKANAG